MEDLTLHEHNINHLPVHLSDSRVSVEQLLGVRKLAPATGEAQASAVIVCLNECGIEDQVSALCFDTTASNMGPSFQCVFDN